MQIIFSLLHLTISIKLMLSNITNMQNPPHSHLASINAPQNSLNCTNDSKIQTQTFFPRSSNARKMIDPGQKTMPTWAWQNSFPNNGAVDQKTSQQILLAVTEIPTSTKYMLLCDYPPCFFLLI